MKRFFMREERECHTFCNLFQIFDKGGKEFQNFQTCNMFVSLIDHLLDMKGRAIYTSRSF